MTPHLPMHSERARTGDSMKGWLLLRFAWIASMWSLAACGDPLMPLEHVPPVHTATKTPSTDTSLPSVAGTSKPVTAGLSAAPPSHSLIRVPDPSTVCMVNNRYMGDKQIPVMVEGKTYFGCCEMCKGRLERDPSARLATDPVNGRSIDKATAVIGRDGSNKVFYFESETTFHQFGGS